MVQESVSMLYADRGASWIDEDMPIDSFPIARANIAAETNAKRFTGAGGTGIVLRFGWFYGPGAAHSEQMLAMSRHHIGPLLGPPDSYVSSIHVADAAAAVAAALRAPAGTFNVVDDEPLTKRQYAAALADAAGKAIWLRGPGRAALFPMKLHDDEGLGWRRRAHDRARERRPLTYSLGVAGPLPLAFSLGAADVPCLRL